MKTIPTLAAAAFAALLLLPGCGSSPESGTDAAAPAFDEVVASRRSVRDYEAGTTVSEAQVRTLIATAMEAPSWANTQTTRYYVALSEEKVAAVKEMIGPFNARNTANAPVMIVSTFVKEQSGFGQNGPAGLCSVVYADCIFGHGVSFIYRKKIT